MMGKRDRRERAEREGDLRARDTDMEIERPRERDHCYRKCRVWQHVKLSDALSWGPSAI